MLSGQYKAQPILMFFSGMKAIAARHRGFSNYPRDLLCSLGKTGPALRRPCDRMKKSATKGTMAAANGMALALNELSMTAPPINPPSALAILKAEMFAVAASSGAALHTS